MDDVLHILLVEDNQADASRIEEMLVDLTPTRIQLDSVATLKDALERVERSQYAMILLDLSLSDSYGIDNLLKISAVTLETPIVVLTGVDDEALGLEAIELGAQDYISKSYMDSRLLSRSIRYAIARQRAELSLLQSHEEYRSLIDDIFDTSMVAVLILDRDFHVMWCNSITEVYFGIGRERLLGRDKRKLVDEELKCIFDDPEDYASRLLHAYTDNLFTDYFVCKVIPEGDRKERWLSHWSQPIRDGMYMGGRIEQYADITAQKVLELKEREQREFAEVLHDISTLLTSSFDLEDVLKRILTNLGRAVPHESALITIIEDGYYQTAQNTSNTIGDSRKVFEGKQLRLDYKTYADMMYTTHQPVIIPDLQNVPHMRDNAIEAQVHSYLGVPIQLQENVIGFINLLSEKKDFFTEEHAAPLVAVAKLAAVAIQNARMFNRSRQLATLQERQRLARDLHDSVSQTLFTCHTLSETALRRWHKDPKQAYEYMQDVHQLTSTALAEMRILLLELRPAALTEIGIKQLFEQYLQPVQERRMFELHLSIEDIAPVPPDAQIALYRIAQEAMNNIVKHSQASKVEIRVREDAGRLIIGIQDDGRGFDIENTPPTSMGLAIIRERSEAIGAVVQIQSTPEQGTEIKVIWERTKYRNDKPRENTYSHR